MIERYRQVMKLISEQMKRYGMSYNAKGVVENAAEKVQIKLAIAQNFATEKYNIVTKKLNDQSIIIQDLNAKALETNVPLPGKIVKVWQWYNQLVGMDTVETARKQVVTLQDKLFQCHDNRRILNKELTDLTYKLQEIYAELIQTKREDPKYVQLTIVEHKSLQEQKKLINQLTLSEKEERDNFMQLATAIKDYHISQNLNAQKYKYLSIIASAIFAIVSLIGSMILNNKRILDVRNTIKTAQDKNESLFQKNMHELSDFKKILQSFDTKLVTLNKQQSAIDLTKEINKSNTSNILVSSAKYSANLLISGLSYVKKGIYVCGSYIFYK
ncbi:PREDICTED: coiled-coil domain-containing protein 51-like [Atta cephalotes]|uniref:Coiled-coil domain-containing protein 51 n=2 Tax=Atta TaxID=12956 RepID=A0A158NR75_ATTCE|nr:PREDICTED: coiled-coil domain-containing protein 51-like [Atta cephalotes]XP_018048274.1 PREDICTED: coiled-coil domain-containing protein 51-like [Atta colombica]KYM82879.1 Coiled-coil domain-containing protein 51 [Atta colombica]